MKAIATLIVMMMTATAGASGSAVSALQAAAGGSPAAQVPAPAAAAGADKAEKYDQGVTEGDWKHANLAAADGSVISIDYIPITAPDYVLANPVWVNVWFSGPAPKKVTAILSNFLYVTSGPSPVKDTEQVTLYHAGGGRYTGRFQRVLLSEGVYSYGGNIYRQELAINRDGEWLRDPVNGTHNFRFQMNNSRGGEKAAGPRAAETVFVNDAGCRATVEKRAAGTVIWLSDAAGQRSVIGYLDDFSGGDISGFCSPAEVAKYSGGVTLSCNGQAGDGFAVTRGYAVVDLSNGLSAVKVRGDAKKALGWKTYTDISCEGFRPAK